MTLRQTTLADPSARASEESIKPWKRKVSDPETARAMYRMLCPGTAGGSFCRAVNAQELADNVDKLKG